MLQSSTEYLHIAVDGPGVDTLVAADIEVAIQPNYSAPSAWLPVTAYSDGVIRHLVGPGSLQGVLPTGTCSVYVRVTSAPEHPVLKTGSILVTEV